MEEQTERLITQMLSMGQPAHSGDTKTKDAMLSEHDQALNMQAKHCAHENSDNADSITTDKCLSLQATWAS